MATTTTCVTLPNSTAEDCSNNMNLECQNLLLDYNVTYDAIALGEHVGNHSSHEFATCRVEEACVDSGDTSCNIIDEVLMEMEASICPGMCYYMIIPYAECSGTDPGQVVYTMKLKDDGILIKKYKMVNETDVSINGDCEVDQITPESCNVTVDSTCPGTTVASFDSAKNVQVTLSTVDGKESVGLAFNLKSHNGSVTVLATVTTARPENIAVNTTFGTTGRSKMKYELASTVLDLVFVDEYGVQLILEDGDTIDLTFNSQKPSGYQQTICTFYEEKSAKWSRFGCELTSSNETAVICTCNHTTSFAVLLQFEDCLIEGTNLFVQTLLTRFMSAVSIVALLLTVIIFCYLKLYSSDQVKVHLSLAVSMALAQVIMLLMDKTGSKTVCTIIAVVAHYFWSVYCASMLQEGVLLQRKASKHQKGPVKGWVILLTGWGIPAVLVSAVAGAMTDGYGTACSCWLSTDAGTMWVFLAEIAIVVCVNLVLLYMIMRTFVSLKANTKKTDTEKLKATTRAIVIMAPMLGMTWIFGVLQAYSRQVFMQYLFMTLMTLQGPMFFVFQCVMHPEVQKIVRKRKVSDSKWAMSTSSSGGTMITDKGETALESKFTKGF